MNLLQEADIQNENDIIQYIYDSLEPDLQLVCSMNDEGEDNEIDTYCH